MFQLCCDASVKCQLGAEDVDRVILCSGKVAFDLMAERDRRGARTAILRVEQLYPWPFAAVERELLAYPNAREILWVQEEPENMGSWQFVRDRFDWAGRATRKAAASPATGSLQRHKAEQAAVVARALRQN